MTLRPIKANPGGFVAPNDVVGRSPLIATIQDVLSRQSVLLVAERRIGKTTVVKAVERASKGELVFRYRDVEHIASPELFARTVAEDIAAWLRADKRAYNALLKTLRSFGGIEIGGVLKLPKAINIPWDTLLRESVTMLMKHSKGRTYVFAWDEFPLMLEAIRRTVGADSAMAILDTCVSNTPSFGWC